MKPRFRVESRDRSGTQARRGRLETAHGGFDTPAFMAVGTQATVKTLDPDDLAALGAPIILANTYHLYLRPGAGVIARLGGVGRFMGWPGPLLTDSGGFQVFSLAHRRRVDEDGVTFRSHVDGSEHRFTPDSVMAIQRILGADVVMAFDECVDATAERAYVEAATSRTHRWAASCRQASLEAHQAVFGIVQGGTFPDLRRWSAQELAALDFPGYGIGGLSVGEEKAVTYEMAAIACDALPADRPRYLMGVGSPDDLLEAIAVGVDLFDSVLPTRLARNGALLTGEGRVNIRNAVWARETGPIDPACGCSTCSRFSAAYLHHLFRAGEVLGLRLATLHNLWFVFRLMADARQAIVDGRFVPFLRAFRERYRQTDQLVRAEQRRRWKAARDRAGAPP